MSDTPIRAFRRASILAASAIAAVVLGGLGMGRLASDSDRAPLPAAPHGAEPAHAMAAPPQSLAFTADFFQAMGLDARDEPAEPPPAPAAVPVPAPCSLGDKHELAERHSPPAPVPVGGRVASDAVPDSAVLTTASAAATLSTPVPAERPAPTAHLE